MKRILELASLFRRRVNASVDTGDVVGLVGAVLAYDGARTVFGSGWARLGLGLALLGVYVARELRIVKERE